MAVVVTLDELSRIVNWHERAFRPQDVLSSAVINISLSFPYRCLNALCLNNFSDRLCTQENSSSNTNDGHKLFRFLVGMND